MSSVSNYKEEHRRGELEFILLAVDALHECVRPPAASGETPPTFHQNYLGNSERVLAVREASSACSSGARGVPAVNQAVIQVQASRRWRGHRWRGHRPTSARSVVKLMSARVEAIATLTPRAPVFSRQRRLAAGRARAHRDVEPYCNNHAADRAPHVGGLRDGQAAGRQ